MYKWFFVGYDLDTANERIFETKIIVFAVEYKEAIIQCTKLISQINAELDALKQLKYSSLIRVEQVLK